MRRCACIALVFSALSLVGFGWAGAPPPTPEKVVEKVKAVYSGHCCFHATFDQLTVNVAMDLRDRFQGVMYVKKPGLIALDVKAPEKQKVVIQGRAYTVYFPGDRSAVRGDVPPEVNLDHFFGFFANIGEMERNFSISFPDKAQSEEEGLIFLELQDKKNPKGTLRIVLGVDSKSYLVRRAIIYDALGNYNRFHLSDITLVDSIPDSQFRIDYGSQDTETRIPTPFFQDSDKK